MGWTAERLEEEMDYGEFREHMLDASMPPVFPSQSEWLLARVAAWLLNFGRKGNLVAPADLLGGGKAEKTAEEVEAELKGIMRGR